MAPAYACEKGDIEPSGVKVASNAVMRLKKRRTLYRRDRRRIANGGGQHLDTTDIERASRDFLSIASLCLIRDALDVGSEFRHGGVLSFHFRGVTLAVCGRCKVDTRESKCLPSQCFANALQCSSIEEIDDAKRKWKGSGKVEKTPLEQRIDISP